MVSGVFVTYLTDTWRLTITRQNGRVLWALVWMACEHEAAAVAEKPDSGDMRLVAVRNLQEAQ